MRGNLRHRYRRKTLLVGSIAKPGFDAALDLHARRWRRYPAEQDERTDPEDVEAENHFDDEWRHAAPQPLHFSFSLASASLAWMRAFSSWSAVLARPSLSSSPKRNSAVSYCET